MCSEAGGARPISQFATEEIIIPNGPFAGQFYSADTQPFIRHYFNAIESGRYQRFVAVGCTQSGKTLSCSVIPALWHVFECEDDMIYAAPTGNMARDKWVKDMSPVIRRTRYANQIPTTGIGSRGGTPIGINFLNGASMRFMTGGGSDKTVSAYTARVIVVTEVDGMDDAGGKSREADRISQLEVRGDAFGSNKRVYLECTASITDGRIWQEYLGGTKTIIEKCCPYCDNWVVPEMEHVAGWLDEKSERTVLEQGHFICPSCERPLTKQDRVKMMHGCRVSMSNPESMTFSFRWNAFDNLFWSPGEIALDMWRAKYKPTPNTEEGRIYAQKVLHQFKWSLPYDDVSEEIEEVIDLNHLECEGELGRGVIPAWAELLTFGMDIGYKRFHWVLIAWRMDGTGHVVDYGEIETPWEGNSHERAVEIGLKEDFLQLQRRTWAIEGKSATMPITFGLLDSNWLPEIVRPYCHGVFLPAVGVGETNNFRKLKRAYRQPKEDKAGLRKYRQVKVVGDHYHLLIVKPEHGAKYKLIEHDVDEGKTYVHRRLATPQGQPGRLTLFLHDEEDGHLEFMNQLTAEYQVWKKGVLTWEERRKKNHYLDATVLACRAARVKGVKVLEPEAEIKKPEGGLNQKRENHLTTMHSQY